MNKNLLKGFKSEISFSKIRFGGVECFLDFSYV